MDHLVLLNSRILYILYIKAVSVAVVLTDRAQSTTPSSGGFWWLMLPTDHHTVFLWCLRHFYRDVLKAGFWFCFSPLFSSLTGTRKFKLGQNGQGLGEAEVGPPPQLTLTLTNVCSSNNPGVFSFKSEPSWFY